MIKELLAKKKPAVLKRWLDLVINTYPVDSRKFFKGEKDPFANPVGRTIARETESLLDILIEGADLNKANDPLQNIIKIRAVQDFSPSEAVIFVYLLKRAILEEIKDDARADGVIEELLEFESRIDALLLKAFDIYMECREKIFAIRTNELKKRSARLIERVNEGDDAPIKIESERDDIGD